MWGLYCPLGVVSTGSSSCSFSSSDSYIVIKSLSILRLWVFLIAFLLLGIDTVIADEGSLPSGCLCFGVGFLSAPPPQAPSLVSPLASLELYPFVVMPSSVVLFAIFRVGSIWRVTESALVIGNDVLVD